MQACDRCHARKTRCDRRIPQCTACEKAGAQCLHADKLRQRNLPRGYIDNMESLVEQLREENRLLRCRLADAETTSDARRSSATQSGASELDPNSTPFGQEHVQSGTDASTPASSSKGSPVDDAFALEVGYLSLIATGETRYLGSSSGIGLASIISTVVSAQSGVAFLSADQQAAPAGRSVRPDPIVPSDASFPSLAAATPFIEAYFQHTHITFPLLHRPSFMVTVERIFKEPGYYEANTFDAFVFDMVLAIGGSNFNRFEESTAMASKCFAMAQSKVKAVMEMGGLASLKAILLISQHGIFSNLCDTSASIWHLIGIGARICFELGLHLEHKRLSGCPADFAQQANVVTLEEELGRRCFWCLYNLDRVVSFTLGRPVAIRDEEMDVPLPSHLDDDYFGQDRPIVAEPQGSNDSTRKTSPFLHLIRIRRMSGQILGLFYNSRHLADVPLEEKRRIRRQFEDKINTWRNDTNDLCLTQAMAGHNYVSSFVSPEWYNAVYSNAILLLYRPSPYLPHPAMIADQEGGEPDLLKLLHAAKNSIISYSELHRKRRLNYSWITLHGVFIAGLAFIYCVGRILRDPGMRGVIPDFVTIVDVTRACSNVLVAICERWNVSRRSSELFNNLSNAVIRDALNATVRQDKGGRGGRPGSNMPSSRATTGGGSLSPGVSRQQQGHQGAGTQHYGSSVDVGLLGSMPQLDDILVMDEFRQYAGSFDMANQTDGSYPSELVSGFLQDWPFDVPFDAAGGFDSSVQGMSQTW
ncbi:C6 zinc finger domain containing protein [Pleurostoma richardsiae]|uniref:C6 zinc finger domain containing protein n=1 Tax=Pleurostoma richardsiae TaxID=41990 RepID=A0AA38S1I5_9PEZI|nr:C6 zinc finger domain containing protein [Pleurostoma richardsiae]